MQPARRKREPQLRPQEEVDTFERSANLKSDDKMQDMMNESASKTEEDAQQPRDQTAAMLAKVAIMTQRMQGTDQFDQHIRRLKFESPQPQVSLAEKLASHKNAQAFKSLMMEASLNAPDHHLRQSSSAPSLVGAIGQKEFSKQLRRNPALNKKAVVFTGEEEEYKKPKYDFRNEAARTLRRLLVDMDLDRQPDVGGNAHGLVVRHFDARYEWFLRHTKKPPFDDLKAPSYIKFQKGDQVMPGSMRVELQPPSPALRAMAQARATSAPSSQAAGLGATLRPNTSPMAQ
mmetsp:Transcript_6635/g.16245  ORF Transcript_6635/g.16245 Transcript_6635/m.16245 type:complete len:288 (-) Transcript_6635:43-906(-)